MRKTNCADEDFSKKLTVDINGLQSLLSCGMSTARKIGKDSGAEIHLGRRVLYVVEKVKTYINEMSK